MNKPADWLIKKKWYVTGESVYIAPSSALCVLQYDINDERGEKCFSARIRKMMKIDQNVELGIVRQNG